MYRSWFYHCCLELQIFVGSANDCGMDVRAGKSLPAAVSGEVLLRPVELAAFKTALSVAGLYRFDLTDELVRSTLVMLILLSGIKVLPFRERPWTAKETVVRMSVGILCLMAFIVNAVTSSWDAILGIEIGHWSSYEVYAENGSVLSFILEGQEMRVDAPDEYSARKWKNC